MQCIIMENTLIKLRLHDETKKNPVFLNGDEHDFKNIMELSDRVLQDLISLTKVGVVAPDEISKVLLRSLVWGSELINDFEEQTNAESRKVS